MEIEYQALLLVSFGGPEGPDDVSPFLENVLRGRKVPPERVQEIARHYEYFGGVSPINRHNRELAEALSRKLREAGPDLPVYWGNRNWHPFLDETLEIMRKDGVSRALALVTSAFSSYSSCGQYLEDIESAREKVGKGAPEIDKLRVFFNHPGYIGALYENLSTALEFLPEKRRREARVVFTGHSIPLCLAKGCRYQEELRETAHLVARRTGCRRWILAYQSRSGSPHIPWLEPDIIWKCFTIWMSKLPDGRQSWESG